MPRVVHFEIGAEDVEKIKSFYKNVFNWEYSNFGEGEMLYTLVKTGDGPSGINGGIFKSKDKHVTVNTIDVPNIDEYIKKIEENGGVVVVEKHEIPGIGHLAYCKDCEENLFGIIQPAEMSGR